MVHGTVRARRARDAAQLVADTLADLDLGWQSAAITMLRGGRRVERWAIRIRLGGPWGPAKGVVLGAA